MQGADAPLGNVVTAHCCNAAMRSTMGSLAPPSRRLNYQIGVVAERYCFQRASTVIAVSSKVSVEIQRHYGVDPNRIVVIPHGVDTKVFAPFSSSGARNEARRRLGLSADDFTVLFIGSDYRLKGLIPLLSAAAKIPNVRLLVVGVTPDSTLASLSKKCAMDGRVIFHGKTLSMAPLYAAADCFVLPTRYDTFSLTTFEAMASGLPVIVSREAGVSELLRADRDSMLLDDPNDTDVLAERLRLLLEDRSLRSSLGAEARRTAERHSWDGVAERTLQVYRQTLAGHS